MTDPINNLTPGTPLNEEQRKALAEANAKESTEANRLAAEHIARDAAEGRGTPIVAAVADSLKAKLQGGEFHDPSEGTKSRTQ